jgi:catechol 2,3-dioxygenase-like lactoylglutathione lyase family enzyme
VFGTDKARGIPSATNVDHLGITVPDLQQAIGFFTEVLGAEFLFSFQEGPGTSNPANLNQAFGVPPDSKLHIAMLRLGPTLNLELMEYESSDQRKVMPRNSDYDAPHIAFFVSDMDAAAAYLIEHGCKIFSGPLVSERGPKAGQSIRYFQAPWVCSWRSCPDPSICPMRSIRILGYSDP